MCRGKGIYRLRPVLLDASSTQSIISTAMSQLLPVVWWRLSGK